MEVLLSVCSHHRYEVPLALSLSLPNLSLSLPNPDDDDNFSYRGFTPPALSTHTTTHFF